MATTTQATPVNGVRQPGRQVGAPLPTSQRRPALVGLGVLMVVALGTAGAYLYEQAGSKVSVVVVARGHPAGPHHRAIGPVDRGGCRRGDGGRG